MNFLERAMKGSHAVLLLMALFGWRNATAQGDLFAQDSLRYKIGQMLIFGFYGNTVPEEIKEEIHDYNVGGVLLYRAHQNLSSREQMRDLIADLQASARIPLLIATDQEGGRVSNLNANNGFSSSPTAYAMGLRTSERYSEQIGNEFADWFDEVGLNTDFAPVVDLRLQSNNVIGDRSFSADADTVVLNASWFIDAFRRRNLITALKHFPGHGSSIGDSHAGFTDVTNTWTETELEPFKRLIDAGQADLIMTAHIFNSRIDSLFPATLSYKTLTTLLRDSLGYGGAVITDAMGMRAISDNYGFTEAITLAINAGADILLYNWDDDFQGHRLAPLFIDHVETEVLRGSIARERIEASYRRILRLKQTFIFPSLIMDEKTAAPNLFNLCSFPNPFNARTQICYTLHESEQVSAEIVNILGQPVRRLVQNVQTAGEQRLLWDGKDETGKIVSSGLYFFVLQTEQHGQLVQQSIGLHHIK